MIGTDREFIGYGKDYPRIVWPDEAQLAVSIVVNFEEGSERTPLYGDSAVDPMSEGFVVPPGPRDLRRESFFDYGTRVAYWRLLDIFHAYDVKVTFNACGMALENSPAAAAEMTARGHEPMSHGYRWLPSFSLTLEEEREHVRKAVEAIQRTTGERPLGWNTRGTSVHTRELLIEEGGFVYDSDTYADDLPYFIEIDGRRWLTIPYSFETNDQKLFRPPGSSEPGGFLEQLKAAFDYLHAEGRTHPKMMTVALHMRHIGRPAGAAAIEEFIRYARGSSRVWFARRIDIARWWLEHYSELPAMKS